MGSAYRISDWLSEVDNLSLSATIAAPEGQAGHIRALCMLARLRPEALGGPALSAAGEGEVMRNVACGAFETAALRLLPSEAHVMTSTPGGKQFVVSVRLPGQGRDSTSSGHTFALAVVSALALSIADLHHELDTQLIR